MDKLGFEPYLVGCSDFHRRFESLSAKPRDPREGLRVNSCPFCGGPPDIRYNTECGGHGEYYKTVKIVCTRCGASTKSFVCDRYYGEKTDERDAIAAWNRRPE